MVRGVAEAALCLLWLLGTLLFYTARHVPAGRAVLPRAGVLVAIEEQTNSKCPQAGQAGVGHHDHRRVSDPSHRHNDRDRSRPAHTATVHLGVESPQVLADLFNARDLVAIGSRGAVLSASEAERADERHVPHPISELALCLG